MPVSERSQRKPSDDVPRPKHGQFSEKYLLGLRGRVKPYRITEQGTRGSGGRLLVIVYPSDVRSFFYRYQRRGVDAFVPLGTHHARKGSGGITLEDARRKADALRREALAHDSDPRIQREEDKRRKEERARRGTVGDLLGGYVQSLRAAGRVSAREVERAFELHVQTACPKVWALHAADVLPTHISDVLGTLHKRKGRNGQPIRRQVNKVRAYLHAAWSWGARADNDFERGDNERKRYSLATNPVTLVPHKAEWDRAGDRALNDSELALYVRALDGMPQPRQAALRLLLHTGCQRVEQLLRAPWSSYDFGNSTLLLHDAKGKGATREHLLPLTDDALAALAPLRAAPQVPRVFATDADERRKPGPFVVDGKRVPHPTTLALDVGEISTALKEQHGVPKFSLRDLRRTAETTLAALGVPKDVRAHLLSHARTKDVQDRHYDRYGYLPEKAAALEKWQAHLRAIVKKKKGAR